MKFLLVLYLAHAISGQDTSCYDNEVCVDPYYCQSGTIDGNTLERNYLYSCAESGVCCQLRAWDPRSAGNCAVRNLNTSPKGPSPINANFAEFPWQAMILKESTKSLLCGGVIIHKNFVLTTGDCVQGQKSIDILTKGGEWKLGSDEEGIDFELVRLTKISFHPYYSVGEPAYNLALLHLERDYKFNLHIQPLCLEEGPFAKPGDSCVTTGWGKKALEVHKKNAIEHFTQLNIEDARTCQQYVPHFNGDFSICATTNVDACLLDFGSALACQDRSDPQKYVLKGIYSQHTGCTSQYPTLIFTKLDRQWIQQTINRPNRG
ncbi:inactive serine protease scarface-like [Culicoides brevitarsis]|uniref:inactive serine protease scarface-like n=1 Tax=Culicoides brevitarsis TaxID=469753 RepID=UPI00307B363E